MTTLKKIILSACIAIATTSASFAAQRSDYDWVDIIKLTPSGAISNFSYSGDIDAYTLPNDKAAFGMQPKLVKESSSQCKVGPTTWFQLTDKHWIFGATDYPEFCMGDGTVSFTYTVANGKSCQITIRDGSQSSRAQVVSTDCNYTMAKTSEYNDYDVNHIQVIRITNPSFSTETDISGL